MPNYAVVSPNGGEVSNIVVGSDLESVTEVVGPVVEITETTGGASIGWIWNPETGVFTLPDPAP